MSEGVIQGRSRGHLRLRPKVVRNYEDYDELRVL